MENHPIPQDVTGFQFKLIGNMTVKQFAYLATGVILAWVFFQLPIFALIKIPLCAFFALLGTGLAYIPVSGRPMDLMIGNFIKSLFRPTQFVYEKSGSQSYFPNNITLSPNKNNPPPAAPLQKDNRLNLYLQSMNTTQYVAPPIVKPTPMPVREVEQKKDEILISKSNLATDYISVVTPNIIKPNLSIPQVNPIKPAYLSNTPINAYSQKPIVKAPDPKKVPPPLPIPIINIKPIQQRGTGRMTVLPSIPESPNLITGVAKDPRGNALPNVLVEIKDKEGNPVRAFKTNEFGRFASATPLISGDYSIEFEDPKGQNKFEVKKINITGQIIQPIVAISIDTREELRRSLFSQSQ